MRLRKLPAGGLWEIPSWGLMGSLAVADGKGSLLDEGKRLAVADGKGWPGHDGRIMLGVSLERFFRGGGGSSFLSSEETAFGDVLALLPLMPTKTESKTG